MTMGDSTYVVAFDLPRPPVGLSGGALANLKTVDMDLYKIASKFYGG